MRIQHHKHFEYCMDLLATHEYWKLGTIKDPGEWHFLAIKTKVCTSFYYLQALAAYKVHKLPYRSHIAVFSIMTQGYWIIYNRNL